MGGIPVVALFLGSTVVSLALVLGSAFPLRNVILNFIEDTNTELIDIQTGATAAIVTNTFEGNRDWFEVFAASIDTISEAASIRQVGAAVTNDLYFSSGAIISSMGSNYAVFQSGPGAYSASRQNVPGCQEVFSLNSTSYTYTSAALSSNCSYAATASQDYLRFSAVSATGVCAFGFWASCSDGAPCIKIGRQVVDASSSPIGVAVLELSSTSLSLILNGIVKTKTLTVYLVEASSGTVIATSNGETLTSTSTLDDMTSEVLKEARANGASAVMDSTTATYTSPTRAYSKEKTSGTRTSRDVYVEDIVLPPFADSEKLRIVCVSNIDITKEFDRRRGISMLVSIMAIVVGFLLQVLAGWRISRGLKKITAMAGKLEEATTFEDENISESVTEFDTNIAEVAVLQDRFLQMQAALWITSKYVPKEVVTDVLASGILQVFMQPQNVTMLFIDIERFTSICERLSGDDLPILLERYFEVQSQSILRNGGTIDKFIGDAIQVAWGAPADVGDHNYRGMATALQLRDNMLLPENEALFESVGAKLRVRVGVHQGSVLAGNLGCEKRMAYTVIGDNVQLAGNLEAFNKIFGTRIMVSESVLFDVPEDVFLLRVLGRIRSVLEKTTTVYELIGIHPDYDPSRTENRKVVSATTDDRGSVHSKLTSRSGGGTRSVLTGGSSNGGHTENSSQYRMAKESRLSRVATLQEMMFQTVQICHHAPKSLLPTVEKYQHAIELFVRGDFPKCQETVKEYIRMMADDVTQTAAHNLIALCESHMISPPAMDEWRGEIPVDFKE